MKDYTSGWVGVAVAFIDHKRKKKEFYVAIHMSLDLDLQVTIITRLPLVI